MSFVTCVFGRGLCVGGWWWWWSFWALGDGGGWYGPDNLGALLLHETVGSVYAHVVGAGHSMLCFVYVLPVELHRLWVLEEYIASEESEGSAFVWLWFVGNG